MINIPILANTNISQIMQQATQSVQQAGQNMSQSMQSASQKISQSMNQAGQSIKSIPGQATALFNAIPPQAKIAAGAVGVIGVAIAKLGTDYVQTAEYIRRFSAETNMSTDQFQKWVYLLDKDEGAIRGIADTISSSLKDAVDASTDIGKAYQKLGVSVYDTNGQFKTQEAILEELANNLAGVSDSTERARLGSLVFSSDYRKIAPMMNEGTEAWKKNTLAAQDSIKMNYEQVETGRIVKKQWDELITTAISMTYDAIYPLITAFSSLIGIATKSSLKDMVAETSLAVSLLSKEVQAITDVNAISASIKGIESLSKSIDNLTKNRYIENSQLSKIAVEFESQLITQYYGQEKALKSVMALAEKKGKLTEYEIAQVQELKGRLIEYTSLNKESVKTVLAEKTAQLEIQKLRLDAQKKANETKKEPQKTKATTQKSPVAESIIPVNEIKTASIEAQAEIQTLFNFVQYSFSPQKFTIWQAFSEVTPLKNGLALAQKEISATQEKNLAIVQKNYDAQQQALDQNYVEMFVSDDEYLKQTQALRVSYETAKKNIVQQGVDSEKQAFVSASEAFSQSIENRKEALSGLLSATQTVWGAITTTASAFGSLQDTLHQKEMTNLQEQGDKRIALLQEQMLQATMSSRAKILAEKRIADLQKKNEAEAQAREKAYNEKKKGWSITQATIDGVLSVSKTFAEYGATPMGFIMAGIETLASSARVATISAQQLFDGGVVGNLMNGATYGKDNTVVQARKGELMINAPQQRRLWDFISGKFDSRSGGTYAPQQRELWAIANGRSRAQQAQSVNVSMPVTINGNVDRGTLAKLKEQQNDFLQQLEGGLRTLSGKGRLNFAGGRL